MASGTEYQQLVDAATELLLRNRMIIDLETVAAHAGVPIEHAHALFRDAEALRRAVMEGQMLRLFDYLARSCATADEHPLMQFRCLLRGYLIWMAENPVSAQILLEPTMFNEPGDGLATRLSSSIHSLGAAFLERAVAAGQVHPRTDIPTLMLTARALVHGLAYLQLRKVMGEAADPSRMPAPMLAPGDELASRPCFMALESWMDMVLSADRPDEAGRA